MLDNQDFTIKAYELQQVLYAATCTYPFNQIRFHGEAATTKAEIFTSMGKKTPDC